MSWSLLRPNVALRVTRFTPDTPKPIAGLSPLARALHRDRRERECRKVEPAMELDDPERSMCTCHGFDRASEYCISFCGKTRE